MDDLAQFLRDRYDEEARIASAATQGEWVWSREFVTPPGYHHRTIGPLEPGDAAYIVRHDPARVLADIDAKRQIVAGFAPCPRCLDGRRCIGHDTSAGTGTWRFGSAADERVARLLALPYTDHPDYRQEWRP